MIAQVEGCRQGWMSQLALDFAEGSAQAFSQRQREVGPVTVVPTRRKPRRVGQPILRRCRKIPKRCVRQAPRESVPESQGRYRGCVRCPEKAIAGCKTK